MIRIAAVGDVHLGEDARGRLRPALEELGDCADVLMQVSSVHEALRAAAADAGVLIEQRTAVEVQQRGDRVVVDGDAVRVISERAHGTTAPDGAGGQCRRHR